MDKESRIGVELTTFGSKHLDELFFGNQTNIPETWNDWTFHKLQTPRIYQTKDVEQLMPKVKETTGSAASGVGDVAHDLSERAKSVVGADSGSNGSSSRSLDEIAKRRDERAAHRAARRKAS